MDPNKLIFRGLTFFGLVYIIASQSGQAVKDRVIIGRPNAQDLQFDLGSFSIRFTLVFSLTNDLPFAIPTNRFIGAVFLDDTQLGLVSTPLITVESGETKELDTTVVLTLSNVLQSLADIIGNPQLLFGGLRLKGNFISNGLSIPYESNIQLIQ